MNTKRLLVVGELNIDLILNDIQGFPKIGTEIVADLMEFTLGSSSAIMASNISSLGIETSFCGMIGEDQFGEYVLDELSKKKVDTKFIKKCIDYKTGVTVVINYDQDRANVTYCGAMNALKISDIPWNEIKNFHHLHLSSYFLQKGIKNDIIKIFQKAKEAGLSTSLDLQYDPEESWDFDYKSCLPFVDVFLPNEAEIYALTGKLNIEDALNEIIPCANIIALKLGKDGSRLVSGNINIKEPPFLNKNYKDAIGAGDSFNAGFIQKYLEGADLETCLRNGNLMGSLSTTCAGGTTAFTSKKEILNKIKDIEKIK
ncbi:carbohydrate kinase family protein [Autumnicola musiva]|uniref:Carbohydrate kinase family protein n=1 Tax=Autumnicola musiva TaxID=3075589 RepID=A0ABU3DAK8_9FLAO|nr:carbohydrate kinase family protein [Zunongwangia sp. F117]MDT0678569.1 carbohydrate kinase family protein [Zunongwangia sp. F117]